MKVLASHPGQVTIFRGLLVSLMRVRESTTNCPSDNSEKNRVPARGLCSARKTGPGAPVNAIASAPKLA